MAAPALVNLELPIPFPSEREVELSVILLCLNEAETLPFCIGRAQKALDFAGIQGEIIVADNGSTDGSIDVATDLGAIVVHVDTKGYGNALMGGIAAARGKYIVMGDADASCDFGDVPQFLQKLRSGHDLVVGNRFRGGILNGAMPVLHKYLGNPVLPGLGRIF